MTARARLGLADCDLWDDANGDLVLERRVDDVTVREGSAALSSSAAAAKSLNRRMVGRNIQFRLES